MYRELIGSFIAKDSDNKEYLIGIFKLYNSYSNEFGFIKYVPDGQKELEIIGQPYGFKLNYIAKGKYELILCSGNKLLICKDKDAP